MVTTDSVLVITEGLTVADLGEEAVILDVNSGNYFSLNEVGTRICESLTQPTPVRQVIEHLLQEYEASPEEMEQDVLAFLQGMADQKLVRVVHEDTV